MRGLMFLGEDRVATDASIVPFQDVLNGLKHQRRPPRRGKKKKTADDGLDPSVAKHRKLYDAYPALWDMWLQEQALEEQEEPQEQPEEPEPEEPEQKKELGDADIEGCFDELMKKREEWWADQGEGDDSVFRVSIRGCYWTLATPRGKGYDGFQVVAHRHAVHTFLQIFDLSPSAFFSIDEYDEVPASILALEYAQRVAFFFRHYDCRTPRPTESQLCALGGDLYEETKEFEALMMSTTMKPAVRERGQSIRSIFSSASSSSSASAASAAGG